MIIDRVVTPIYFKDIASGDVFIYSDTVYLKFEPSSSLCDDNAVELGCGYACEFDDMEEVQLVKAKLTISNIQ